MQNRPAPERDQSKDTGKDQVAEPRLKPAGEVVVEHHETPPPGPPDKQIHARRPLPLVPAVRPAPQPKKDSDSDKGTDET